MVQHRIRKSLSSVPILSQIYPAHTDSYFLGIHFIFENCDLPSCYTARVAIHYQHFGSTYRSPSSRAKNRKFLFAWFLNPWRRRPLGWTETVVTNYHCSLYNSQEENIYHLLCGGNLKSPSSCIYTVHLTRSLNLQTNTCTLLIFYLLTRSLNRQTNTCTLLIFYLLFKIS